MTKPIEVISGTSYVSDTVSDKSYQSVLIKLMNMLNKHIQRKGGSVSFGNFVFLPGKDTSNRNTGLAGQFAVKEVDGVEVSNTDTIGKVLEAVKHALETLRNRMDTSIAAEAA